MIDDLLSGATPTVPFRVFHLLADLSLRPSLTSPHKGPVIPKMIPPSTCALTVSGLTTVPQSTAQTMGARGFPRLGYFDLRDLGQIAVPSARRAPILRGEAFPSSSA